MVIKRAGKNAVPIQRSDLEIQRVRIRLFMRLNHPDAGQIADTNRGRFAGRIFQMVIQPGRGRILQMKRNPAGILAAAGCYPGVAGSGRR